MNLQEFLDKNKISILPECRALCGKGEEIMKKSLDAFHNEQHVYSILSNLDKFIKSEKDILKRINFNTLLPAIFWHDVWRSLRKPNKRVFKILLEAWYEGLGSCVLFKQFTKKAKLKNKEFLSNIAYIIRKHSRFQLLSKKTIEAKILKDIDSLGAYSMRRLEAIKKQFSNKREINKRNYLFFRFMTKFDLEKKSEKSFHFEWSKKEFIRRKEIFLAKVHGYLKELEKKLGI